MESRSTQAWLWLIIISILLLAAFAVILWFSNPPLVQSTDANGKNTGKQSLWYVLLFALIGVVIVWLAAFFFGIVNVGMITRYTTVQSAPMLCKSH